MELSPGSTRPCDMLLDEPLTGTAELEPCAVDQRCTGSLPGRGGDTGNVSPRRLMVEWSGAARSRPSSPRMDAISPSVRSARRKTAHSVSAVVIATPSSAAGRRVWRVARPSTPQSLLP
jgi:hypothetical protein